MSSRNAIQGPSYLDPLFPIPEGLVDYQHTNVPVEGAPDFITEETDTSQYSDTELETEDFYFDSGDEEIPETIDAPSEFSVVSQTIRTLPSGMQVVDLVIDVEDIPGAINYEFRVVKM